MLKKWMNLKKEKITKLLSFLIFGIIIFKVFCNVTYLFRNTEYDRNHIVGIKKEENLDMVYIGGSAAFVYWQPLRAWNDFGFTSYNFATNGMLAEQIEAYIREVETTQNPELYVIDARPFQYYMDDLAGTALRNGTDAMDITSMARWALIRDVYHYRTITNDEGIASYYVDIAKYHTNTDNLGSAQAWGFVNNQGTSPNKGWEWLDMYAYLEEPENFYTDEKAELSENAEGILIDLLTYCKKEGLNVLFVVCPYYLNQGHYAIYNAMSDVVEDYGFQFLNTNDYYSEMQLDFATDFYNRNHVNLFGASKYTEFLEAYISTHYGLPDHRSDAEYASWDEDYQRFTEEEQQHSQIVRGLISDVEYGKKLSAQLKGTSDLTEWAYIANDSRYTLLIMTGNTFEWPKDIVEEKVLKQWSFEEEDINEIRIVNGTEIIDSNGIDGALFKEGTLGPWSDVPYYLSAEEGKYVFVVNGEDFPAQQAGINAAVFDNNYRMIVDFASILSVDGKCVVNHY